ncbi:zinc finger domain-like protein [Trypanosoma rangeli]|uniref:Palmitoyltransferase n=1 Tax=Trypanosoma rangeli TaxID=5698 RepID=A0A422NSP1_TRYRA|nr:zinc finger domain-like protein [Trypanosoma rangeli]RNF08488.1 zinc finger domain-like protein [Trypanosoma rangeli]|eukprot:RNF08488.1 zinc finger domain-like protein [Trypanosoma rangeli]
MESLLHPFVRHLNRCGAVAYMGLQVGGIVTLFCGISLIVGCTVTFARIALPLLATPGTPYFMLLWFTCSVLSFAILFNYVAAASFRGPCVDAEETRRLAVEGELLPLRQRYRLLDAPARHCGKCRRYRAPREHHCRVCNRCVTKMDHHCPWINNCVDAENQRYFFLLVMYLFVSTGIAFTLISIAYVRLRWHSAAKLSIYGPCSYRLSSFPLFFAWILCGTIFICMIFFVGWNLLHILKNETQIERIILEEKERQSQNMMVPFRNPYDLGRWRNILMLFETRDDPVLQWTCNGGTMTKVVLLLWLALPTFRSSSCDGVHYPTFDDELLLPV